LCIIYYLLLEITHKKIRIMEGISLDKSHF